MPRSPRAALSVVAAVAALLLTAPSASAAPAAVPVSAKKPVGPAPTTTAPAPTAPQVRSCPLRFGVGTPGGPAAAGELAEVASLTGEKPSIVLAYEDFHQAVPLWELEQARAAGATTLLTWEPWTWGGGLEQPAHALDRIAAGDHDDHISAWADQLAAWGHPVMLRFGHEMNGSWYPWAEGVNGNGAGDYVAAWRHVHEVFTAAGATNVEWVWNPNVPYRGSTGLDGLYPGAAHVDVVALDGYNWGTSQPWSAWTGPQQLFGEGLAELRRLAPGKPVLVGETASAEAGGAKAAWNRELVAYLAAQPDVTGLVWFHHDKEVDWRIDSSAASADALRRALGARPCPA